ncbi:cell division regulator GpsB [Halalkalibacter nanhaiisediminis]|uniref:DivIVA domain-containing protein n=1 Tax=Halalkalibacter nanhaiisediminis TaxID=688079 RepID=A0A562QS03_9BACI|nr:cell division regulator GpsB [Halalkalibacter nanhaiisediminis]TWI58970.1 DivIVA domain-containing protein [Halalkalibacter nanhaiisediminis]
MSQQDIRFTAKEILEKDFKTSMRGYNPDEVDKFLDAIIQDYEAFQNKVANLERENEQLKREMKKLSERSQRQTPTQTVGSTNYDILQRLSNLEKKVFGSKLYE